MAFIGARWVMQDQVEPELPSNWKKFICLKDNKPINKLAKYEDPEGNKYKNLVTAIEAFGKMKVLEANTVKHAVHQPAPLVSNCKRKSLPLKIEEVSPSKRQNMSNVPNLRMLGDNLAQINTRKSVPFISRQPSEPVVVKPVLSNSVKQGMEKMSCRSCNITYTSSKSLEVHMKEQHGKKNKKVAPVKNMVECELCQKSYQTQEFLLKHKLQEHAKLKAQSETVSGPIPSNFSCNLCNILFETKKQLKKHNRKLHVDSQTPKCNSPAVIPLIPTPLPSKPSFPPGPPLVFSGVQNGHNLFTKFQPVGGNTKERLSRNEPSENRESITTTSINLFTCEECGEYFHSQKYLNKHVSEKHTSSDESRRVPIPHQEKGFMLNDEFSASLKPGKILEESSFPNDVFDQTVHEFRDDYDLEQNIKENPSLFQTVNPGEGMNYEEEVDDYYGQEEFDEEAPELEIRDLKLKNNYIWQGDYDEEFEQDYYELDENDQDDIEVISSGVNKLPQISDDIEVVEDNSNKIFNRSLLKKSSSQMVQNHPALNSIQNRYSQITITNNADISDDDDGSQEDEDYSDLSDDEETGFPEEITLDDEPDEITLDEDDESEDIVVLNKKGAQEKSAMRKNEDSAMRKNENYELMIAKTDFVNDLAENPMNLSVFKQNAWYAQPPSWKPNKLGEVWNATVPQVCFHFKLHDYPIQPNWSFRSWDAFDEFFTALLEMVNPGKLPSDLFKLKKAKWFHYLDPVIPPEMRVTVETLEEEDIGEEVDILTH